MTLTEEQVKAMIQRGERVTTPNGEVIAIRPKKEDKKEWTERDWLQAIAGLISRLTAEIKNKPDIEIPKIEPAQVTVKPPEVNVTVPPARPIRRWKFDLKKNKAGQTTEIIATALD